MTPEQLERKEKERERKRAYRANNPNYTEKERKQKRAYREANIETLRAKTRDYMREWRATNREKSRARGRSWWAANSNENILDKNRKNKRIWNAANPDKIRANDAKRRASIMVDVSNAPTAKQLAALMLDPCVYCGEPSEHADHVIPLSRGGTHDIDNLVPACSKCNLSKGSKLPAVEWHGRKRTTKNRSVDLLDSGSVDVP